MYIHVLGYLVHREREREPDVISLLFQIAGNGQVQCVGVGTEDNA